MNHDSAELRNALSHYATGITVVTSLDRTGQPLGVTVNSFTSVSLKPPLVLWCLGDQVSGLNDFLATSVFTVNFLSDRQQDISNAFAVPGDASRFEGIQCAPGNNGLPVIRGSIAVFECSRHRLNREGDHWLFLCTVDTWRTGAGAPLLFFKSRYHTLA